MIYLGVVVLSIILIYLYLKLKQKKIYILALLLSIFFAGFRKYVGIDYEIDYFIFRNLVKTKGTIIYITSYLLNTLGLNFSYLTLLLSCFNILLCHFFLKNRSKQEGFEGWILYFLDYGYVSSFNVMRQGVANFLYLLGIKQQQKLKLIIIFIAGFGFHKSILILAPSILFLRKSYSRKFLFISFIFSVSFTILIDIQTVFKNFILPNLWYYGDIYSRKNLLRFSDVKHSLGLGLLFRISLSCFLIYFYDKIKKENKKDILYVNTTIVWGLLSIMTFRIFIISRILEYLYLSSLISYPILFKEIRKYKYGKLFIYLILLCFVMLFIKSTVLSDLSQKLLPYQNIIFDKKIY